MKSISTFFSNKIQDSDANHSVVVDSYDTANDLKPAYDPLSLRREATVTDKDGSQVNIVDKPPIKKVEVKQLESVETVIQVAGKKFSSWLDVDALEEKFEDIFGYKVSITPSKKGQTLHEKAQQHKNAMQVKKEE